MFQCFAFSKQTNSHICEYKQDGTSTLTATYQT